MVSFLLLVIPSVDDSEEIEDTSERSEDCRLLRRVALPTGSKSGDPVGVLP